MALKPEGSLEFLGLKVDLVKGLENPLIQWADPEWHRRGKTSGGEIRIIDASDFEPYQPGRKKGQTIG